MVAKKKKSSARILIVTPEITYLPDGRGNMFNQLRAKAGGLADVSASLVPELYKQGADVHVALPHYRKMFHGQHRGKPRILHTDLDGNRAAFWFREP